MPTVVLRAFPPVKSPIAVDNMQSLIDRQLGQSGFAGDMIRAMGDYPTAQPWTSPTPKKGPRRGGRRTGTLGRGWKLTSKRRSLIEVTNRVNYAVFVEGPRRGSRGRRQTRVMRNRGWPNITDESRKVWRKHRRAIIGILTQEDRRLRRRRTT